MTHPEDELEVEVFRAGDYGERGRFTEEDLDAIAGAYAPERHEAPVTLDHAQRGPAHGWVRRLRRAGDRLLATLSRVSPALREWLREGAYRKCSVELYRGGADAGGRPSLKAVSFLGAAIPEVKGLAAPVVFSEAPPAPENAAADECDTAAREAQERLERLRREGRLLPAWERAGLSRFCEALAALDTRPLAGKDAPAGEALTPRRWFLRFLEELPPLAPPSSGAAGGDAAPLAFEAREAEGEFALAPGRTPVDPRSVERHRRALRFLCERPGMTYAEALRETARG